MATRNLWLAIGLHAGADFTVYGVSGFGPGAHIFRSLTAGPSDWTGDVFGPAYGAVYLALAVVVTALLLVEAVRRHYVVPLSGRQAAGFETTPSD